MGLVEARVIGARAGEGDVIVILDAHCECVSFMFSSDSNVQRNVIFRSRIGYHHYLLG